MKKFVLSVLLLCSLFGLCFAMPCFTSYLPDTSGEFVYYQDKTFTRESYVGILYYDDSTFQIRYYAPAAKTEDELLPEKDLAILISVDPAANHWEMTGEKILGTVLPGTDDTEIVNYLHDFLYEFSSRRSKIISLTPETQNDESTFTDFVQFGGNVKIEYDCLIPLFNIKNIIGGNGENVLECVTFGQLTDSKDKTFSDFKGISKNISTAKDKKLKIKAGKPLTITFENQQVSADNKWQSQLENIWTLEDYSLITLSKIPYFSEDLQLNNLFVLRKLLLSTKQSYTDFSKAEYKINDSEIKIISQTYQPNGEKFIQTKKILSANKEKNCLNYFSIATYDAAYKNNPGYFESIVKSYKY